MHKHTVSPSLLACPAIKSNWRHHCSQHLETVEECIATESSNTRGGFDSFQEGDATFNKENAQACIEEAEQVLSDSDCDGNMDILSFSADAMTESCGDVTSTELNDAIGLINDVHARCRFQATSWSIIGFLILRI